MDHWHCQRCGAEQVTAPLSVARTKLARSRHKLASHIFGNMTLFFIYFFDPLFRIFFLSPCVPLSAKSFHIRGWVKKKYKAGIAAEDGKPPAFFVYVASERQFLHLYHVNVQLCVNHTRVSASRFSSLCGLIKK